MNFLLLQVDACVSKGRGDKRENVCVVCAYGVLPYGTSYINQLTTPVAYEMSSEVFQYRLVGKVSICTSVWRRHVIGQCVSKSST